MPEMLDDISYLSQEIGPRPAGTEEEQQAALYIAEQMKKRTGFTANIEDFSCASGAGLIEPICFGIPAVFALLAMFNGAFAIPALLVSLVCAVLYLLEIFDKPVLSRAMERGVSQNVVAKYVPGVNAGPRSRKIVIVANYDSGKVRRELAGPLANAWPILRKGAIVALCVLVIIWLLRSLFFADGEGGFVQILNFINVVCVVLTAIPAVLYFLQRAAAYNEAANHNASGVAVMMRVAQRIAGGMLSEEELQKRKGEEGADDQRQDSGMDAGIMPGQGRIHGEEAVRAAGLVPEGVEIEYSPEAAKAAEEEQASRAAARKAPESEADRLASAKGAIAALTGRPVREYAPEPRAQQFDSPEDEEFFGQDDFEYDENADYGEYAYQEGDEEAYDQNGERREQAAFEGSAPEQVPAAQAGFAQEEPSQAPAFADAAAAPTPGAEAPGYSGHAQDDLDAAEPVQDEFAEQRGRYAGTYREQSSQAALGRGAGDYGTGSVPDWYRKAQERARRVEDDRPVRRSRYADALDAAIAASSEHFAEANAVVNRETGSRLEQLREEISAVQAPTSAEIGERLALEDLRGVEQPADGRAPAVQERVVDEQVAAAADEALQRQAQEGLGYEPVVEAEPEIQAEAQAAVEAQAAAEAQVEVEAEAVEPAEVEAEEEPAVAQWPASWQTAASEAAAPAAPEPEAEPEAGAEVETPQAGEEAAEETVAPAEVEAEGVETDPEPEPGVQAQAQEEVYEPWVSAFFDTPAQPGATTEQQAAADEADYQDEPGYAVPEGTEDVYEGADGAPEDAEADEEPLASYDTRPRSQRERPVQEESPFGGAVGSIGEKISGWGSNLANRFSAWRAQRTEEDAYGYDEDDELSRLDQEDDGYAYDPWTPKDDAARPEDQVEPKVGPEPEAKAQAEAQSEPEAAYAPIEDAPAAYVPAAYAPIDEAPAEEAPAQDAPAADAYSYDPWEGFGQEEDSRSSAEQRPEAEHLPGVEQRPEVEVAEEPAETEAAVPWAQPAPAYYEAVEQPEQPEEVQDAEQDQAEPWPQQEDARTQGEVDAPAVDDAPAFNDMPAGDASPIDQYEFYEPEEGEPEYGNYEDDATYDERPESGLVDRLTQGWARLKEAATGRREEAERRIRSWGANDEGQAESDDQGPRSFEEAYNYDGTEWPEENVEPAQPYTWEQPVAQENEPAYGEPAYDETSAEQAAPVEEVDHTYELAPEPAPDGEAEVEAEVEQPDVQQPEAEVEHPEPEDESEQPEVSPLVSWWRSAGQGSDGRHDAEPIEPLYEEGAPRVETQDIEALDSEDGAAAEAAGSQSWGEPSQRWGQAADIQDEPVQGWSTADREHDIAWEDEHDYARQDAEPEQEDQSRWESAWREDGFGSQESEPRGFFQGLKDLAARIIPERNEPQDESQDGFEGRAWDSRHDDYDTYDEYDEQGADAQADEQPAQQADAQADERREWVFANGTGEAAPAAEVEPEQFEEPEVEAADQADEQVADQDAKQVADQDAKQAAVPEPGPWSRAIPMTVPAEDEAVIDEAENDVAANDVAESREPEADAIETPEPAAEEAPAAEEDVELDTEGELVVDAAEEPAPEPEPEPEPAPEPPAKANARAWSSSLPEVTVGEEPAAKAQDEAEQETVFMGGEAPDMTTSMPPIDVSSLREKARRARESAVGFFHARTADDELASFDDASDSASDDGVAQPEPEPTSTPRHASTSAPAAPAFDDEPKDFSRVPEAPERGSHRRQPAARPAIADIPAINLEARQQRAPLAEDVSTPDGRSARRLESGRIPRIDLSSNAPEPPAAPGAEDAAEIAEMSANKRAALRTSLPSLSGAFGPLESENETVSTTGSFAPVGATGAFAPVGDELIAELDPDDIYVEDADDSPYEEHATETGAFAGPGYVEMPESRASRFFGRFRKRNEEETSASAWLDVDEDFNPTEVGKERGGWESFAEGSDYKPRTRGGAHREDDDDDWNGGAFGPESAQSRDNQKIAEEVRLVYSFRNPDVNTEVWFVALGSELAANGGTRAFLREHAQELRGAVVINLESLGAGELSYVAKEGLFQTRKPSSRLKRYLRKAAEATGVKLADASIDWRESIASIALRNGMQGMTIAGMDGAVPAGMNQGDDVVENIDAEQLDKAVEFVLEIVKNV